GHTIRNAPHLPSTIALLGLLDDSHCISYCKIIFLQNRLHSIRRTKMSDQKRNTGSAPDQGDWFADIFDSSSLTKSQRRVGEVILRNPRLASFADTADLVQRSDVNNSTVVRTAQALGYHGCPALQRELRARYLATISSEDTLLEHGSYQSPLHDALDHDIENLRHTAESITGDDATRAVEALSS